MILVSYHWIVSDAAYSATNKPTEFAMFITRQNRTLPQSPRFMAALLHFHVSYKGSKLTWK